VIDLHVHTTESDGTTPPPQILDLARDAGLEALAICDHDTLGGYDAAAPLAAASGVDLVCGIELSTRWRRAGDGRCPPVHLLGYFLDGAPGAGFRQWLDELQKTRHDRNRHLVERLQSLGVAITMDEVRPFGRRLPGRPHFARLLVEKGYARTIEEAFKQFLGEFARAYVARESPEPAEGIRRVIEAGGTPCLAHPKRLARMGAKKKAQAIEEMVGAGLRAVEVYHSEHTRRDIERYTELAQRYSLAITGGSDFHGANKPNIVLGMGSTDRIGIPSEVLENLRASLRS
jgi:3',5'-nucleoside bisphosphate phosphatase